MFNFWRCPIGYVTITHGIPDGKGTRVAKDFLGRLLIEFAKQSAKYIDYVDESPFIYDIQLHSICAGKYKSHIAFSLLI